MRTQVRLADGRDVWCPERCIGRAELEPGDELWETNGYPGSLTVLAADGTPRGWVPRVAEGEQAERVRPQ